VLLGGGRENKEDAIDPAVGLVLHKKVGDAVARGEPLLTVCYNSDARLGEAISLLENAFRVTNTARYLPRPLVHQVIQPNPPERSVAAGAAAWPY
jgi:pyrimidine-nucleoside phosphorylase